MLFAFAALLCLAGAELEAAPSDGQQPEYTAVGLHFIAGAATKGYERWREFFECASGHHTAVVVGIMSVAKRSEEACLYHLSERMKQLDTAPDKTYIAYSIVYGTQNENLASSLNIINDNIKSTERAIPKDHASVFADAGIVVRTKLKALRWLEMRIRELRRDPLPQDFLRVR